MLVQNKYKDSTVLILIFLSGIILHLVLYFAFFNFSRAIRAYPDELRYYDIARSLFNGEGLKIRNIPSAFQKIGYSLVIIPFFAIKDVVLRLRAIGITNVIVMNLSVIFIWLLCSEIGLNRRNKTIITIFTAILPEMMVSMAYVSEVLYWPVFILLIYIWIVNERKQSCILAVLEGIVCYLCYLTKEIAAAFILARIALEIMYPVLSFMLYDNKNIRDYFSSKRMVILGVFILAFTACYAIMKLTIFRSLGNSYSGQIGFNALLSQYNLMYFFYAFFYHIAAILVVGLVVPFIYAAVNFKSLNEKTQKLFCYIVLFLLISSAAMTYTISIREHLGSVKPSIILRYYGASFLIVIAVFLTSMQNTDVEVAKSRRKLAVALTVITTLFTCLLFKGITVNGNSDHYWLMWYIAIDMKLGIIFPLGGEKLHLAVDMNSSALNLPSDPLKIIYTSAVVANMIIVLIVLLILYAYIRKGSKTGGKIFMLILFIFCALTNIAAGMAIRFAYRVDSEAVNEVIAINRYFEHDTLSKILYITYGVPKKRFDRAGRYIDTYIDRRHNFYIVNETDITKGTANNSVNIADITMKSDIGLGYYDKVDSIDYIILQNYDSRGQKKLLNVEAVEELCGKHYTVYKNLNPSVLQFE